MGCIKYCKTHTNKNFKKAISFLLDFFFLFEDLGFMQKALFKLSELGKRMLESVLWWWVLCGAVVMPTFCRRVSRVEPGFILDSNFLLMHILAGSKGSSGNCVGD